MIEAADQPASDGMSRVLAQLGSRSARIREPVLSYGLAVVSVALAVGLALTLQYYQFRDIEMPVLAMAVAVTTWYAGVGPSVLAIVLSTMCFNYFFVEPVYSFYVSVRDVPYFIVFVVWAVILASFAAVRRRIEDNLREARDRLEVEVERRTQQARLLDLTHDSIFVRNMLGVITYWNRGAQELYGWSAEQAIGKRSHELLGTTFPVPIDELTEKLLQTDRWDGELKHTKADGTEVVVASRWSLQRDSLKQPLAVMETNNDVTERKLTEEQIKRLNRELSQRAAELESANKELESFAYSVSHDLRAPLRHCVGYAELLLRHAAPSLDDKGRRYVTMILESSKRMGHLIDDLLGFSRIGRAETRETTVDLDRLVREVVAELGQEAKDRNIAWTIATFPACHGDRSMLRVALVNLVSNAIKFTRTRARAEIQIGCSDVKQGQVEVFVRDNGAGFDMRYVNKLFGVFQRLHLPEEFEGTGIGLATVQRIVQRHGGSVRAEGAVDQGATFYFSLPRA
jgi:PAS domain S-box-containing protein